MSAPPPLRVGLNGSNLGRDYIITQLSLCGSLNRSRSACGSDSAKDFCTANAADRKQISGSPQWNFFLFGGCPNSIKAAG